MTNWKLYELINPSDTITFYAPDDEVAIACALIVGRGQYAASDEDGNNVGGMAFSDMEKWITEWFGSSDGLDTLLTERKAEVVEALESFATMSRAARHVYDTAMEHITDPAVRTAFKAQIQDRERTSMNNITEFAWKNAAWMRGETTEDVAPPRSVFVS